MPARDDSKCKTNLAPSRSQSPQALGQQVVPWRHSRKVKTIIFYFLMGDPHNNRHLI